MRNLILVITLVILLIFLGNSTIIHIDYSITRLLLLGSFATILCVTATTIYLIVKNIITSTSFFLVNQAFNAPIAKRLLFFTIILSCLFFLLPRTTSAQAYYCEGQSLTITATNNGGGLDFKRWEYSSDGVTYSVIVGANNPSYTFVLTPSNGGYYRAYYANNPGTVSWYYTTQPIVVITTPTATGASRCGPGSVTLSASGSSGSYRWYDSSTGSTILSSTSSYSTPANSSATKTYYVAAVSPSGCESPRRAVTATIIALPNAPGTTPGSSCGTGTVNLSASGSPATYNWYSVASGGSSLATTSSYTTPIISTTTTYYVAAVNTSGCEGPRTPVTATVNPIPSTPTATAGSTCGPGTINLSATTGTNGTTTRWYTAPSGGSVLATSTTYTTPTISSSTTYYVSSYNATTGCESSRTAVVATVNTVPAAPGTSGGVRCGSGSVSLSASGSTGSYKWYSSSSGGTALTSGTTYTTPSINTTTTYYVAAVNASGCESTRTPVTATVNSYPAEPTTTDGSRPDPGTVTVIAAGAKSGESYLWYTASTGGTPISGENSSSYTTPHLTRSTMYYVSVLNSSSCESQRKAVTAFIGSTTPLPIQLAYFTGRVAENKTQLNWTTASEIDNDRFEVERSSNGKDFTLIGTVKGSGNSSQKITYGFTDAHPGMGTVYYRLRQVDYSGEHSYSKVISVALGQLPQAGLAQAYPNPFARELNAMVTLPAAGDVRLEVIDSRGKAVYSDRQHMLQGINEVTLPLGSLSTGLYFLKLSGPDISTTLKVLKAQ